MVVSVVVSVLLVVSVSVPVEVWVVVDPLSVPVDVDWSSSVKHNLGGEHFASDADPQANKELRTIEVNIYIRQF